MMRFVRFVALSAYVIVSAIQAQNIWNQFSLPYDYGGLSAQLIRSLSID
jgi:hypothetical protein